MQTLGFTLIGCADREQVFLQGNIDNEGQFSGRANYRWTDALVTKTTTQIAGAEQAMIQVDNDYTGKDFTASIKSINPSILDGGLTGIFVTSYLQSVTPSLALGLEMMWQRQAVNMGPETAISYVARYKGSDWIASAQLQPMGSGINTSYWRRLTEKVEVGADLNLQFQPGMGGRGGLMGSGLRKEGTTTVGVKYDFRNSTFRAQADSSGRLSCYLDKRVLPFVQLSFAGELDQFKVCFPWSFNPSLYAPWSSGRYNCRFVHTVIADHHFSFLATSEGWTGRIG